MRLGQWPPRRRSPNSAPGAVPRRRLDANGEGTRLLCGLWSHTSYRRTLGQGSSERKRISARWTAMKCLAHAYGFRLAVRSCSLHDPGFVPVLHQAVLAFAFAFAVSPFLSPFLSPFGFFALWRVRSRCPCPPFIGAAAELGLGRGCKIATMSCRTEEYSCSASSRFQFSSLTSWSIFPSEGDQRA